MRRTHRISMRSTLEDTHVGLVCGGHIDKGVSASQASVTHVIRRKKKKLGKRPESKNKAGERKRGGSIKITKKQRGLLLTLKW